MDNPERYGFPNAQNAVLPRRNNVKGYVAAFFMAAIGVFAGVKALGAPVSDDTTGEG